MWVVETIDSLFSLVLPHNTILFPPSAHILLSYKLDNAVHKLTDTESHQAAEAIGDDCAALRATVQIS